jgi:transcription initiation factor TFIIB
MCCDRCGFVVRESLVDPGPDWHPRRDDGKEETKRGGEPASPVVGDIGRSTRIGGGEPLTGEMKRLRVRDRQSTVTKGDRTLRSATHFILALAEKLALSESVAERAVQLYRKAAIVGLTWGRPMVEVASATLYAACREGSIPRSLEEVVKESGTDKKQTSACYRKLLWMLDLKMPVPDPVRFVASIASRAEVSERSKRKAVELLRRLAETGVAFGKGTQGFAATVVYLACRLEGESKSQHEPA